MPESILDGAGQGYKAKVNANQRLYVSGITRTEDQYATDTGESYTIASGMVILTSAGESGVFYVKNTQSQGFHITQAIVSLGPSTGGDTADTNRIRVYRNPTTGTLISTATTGPIACNRNFGSTKSLGATMYVGSEGETITDGVLHGQVLMPSGNFRDLVVDEVLTPGTAIAFSIEPQDSNTSMKVMIQVLGYLKDSGE